jgi:hypothetical protein
VFFRSPTQGFVEVTIKRLESMILNEIINLRAKGLLQFYSNSDVSYDAKTNTFTKTGRSLREGDRVFDPEFPSRIMEVSDLRFATQLSKTEVQEGNDYDIVLPREIRARRYRLERADLEFDFFHFYPHEPGAPEVTGQFGRLPAVFRAGEGRSLPSDIHFYLDGKKQILSYDSIEDKKFRVDFSATHVVLAIGYVKDVLCSTHSNSILRSGNRTKALFTYTRRRRSPTQFVALKV